MPGFKFSTFTQKTPGESYTLSIGDQQRQSWDGTFIIIDQGPPRIVQVTGQIDPDSGLMAFSGVVQGDDYALVGYGKYDGAATIVGYLYIEGQEKQGAIRLDLSAVDRKRR